MPIRIVIHGAAGRMGRRLIALGATDSELEIVAAVDSPDHPSIGKDAGALAGVAHLGVPLASDFDVAADCVIDFSVPAATEHVLAMCRAKHVALVLATTGIAPQQAEKIRAAANEIAILWAPNTILVVNLGMRLAQVAARALKDSDADVEILERHHRFKEDAPSGTALKFGELIAAEMGHTAARHGREGRPGRRSHAEIGYHAIRVGDNPGEHTIVFGMLGETLELTVRASSRDCYATGALAAAKFLYGKPPGLYDMNDVLGLK